VPWANVENTIWGKVWLPSSLGRANSSESMLPVVCPNTQSDYECELTNLLVGFHAGPSVATPLLGKCEDETHTPKSGNLESSKTPENSEPDCKGQNTLH
jgi:hypothetical protein